MKVFRISPKSLVKLDDITLCLGYFDALHLGHISLINKSKNLGRKVGVLTMDPNPSSFFNSNVKEINSLEDKIEILETLGVDYFIILETNKDVLNMSPESFVKEIIIPLGVKNVVSGFDYHFGKNKSGDTNFLSYYDEFDTYVCDEVDDENEKVSTTLIKRLLNEGNITRINKLLTRPYQIKGKVIKGNSIGHTIGFPTANIELDSNKIYPKNGVYAGYLICEGKKYLSMINLGIHPTIKKLDKEIVEAHVINESIDLYDKEVTLVFIDYIREERKFDNLEDLVNQLKCDKKIIKSYDKF
ncbi:MAG: bifunctional riboflavin kinase/FAD synthetase [Erysipelotrichaceae bacterium]|nr:bifunctional riboflavin kinase/FAD synthetase [Erysipelotrichaceae bacterium]